MRAGEELLIPRLGSQISDRTLGAMPSPKLFSSQELCIEIGGIPILVRTDSRQFAQILEDRYGSFVSPSSQRAAAELRIELLPPGSVCDAEDLSVRRVARGWAMERGDFRAEWNPQSNRGRVRQTANPYSLDSVLRILHSLILTREGGMLVHGASAVRNGRAFVFAGVSGAGKTTLARLAPPDVTLLTDEISYLRPCGQRTGVKSGESEVPTPGAEFRGPHGRSRNS